MVTTYSCEEMCICSMDPSLDLTCMIRVGMSKRCIPESCTSRGVRARSEKGRATPLSAHHLTKKPVGNAVG